MKRLIAILATAGIAIGTAGAANAATVHHTKPATTACENGELYLDGPAGNNTGAYGGIGPDCTTSQTISIASLGNYEGYAYNGEVYVQDNLSPANSITAYPTAQQWTNLVEYGDSIYIGSLTGPDGTVYVWIF